MPFFYLTGERREKATKHVYIAIRAYGDLKAGCVSAINAVQHDLLRNDISVDVAILSGQCNADDAINDLCRMFLESDATHIMIVDADVTCSPGAVTKLLSFDEDIVCGVYPFKNDDEGYPVFYHDPDRVEFNDKGLIDVRSAPGGFMCIVRHVIERLYKKAAKKSSWQTKGDYGTLPVVEIFHRTVEKGNERSPGDYTFCTKAIQAGYKVHVAPFLTLSHIGDKIWTGCLQTHILHKVGIKDD